MSIALYKFNIIYLYLSDSDSDSVDVEKFLTDVFAQQIMEKNTRIGEE